MTFEERMAELGVDLSDPPQSDGKHLTYNLGSRSAAEHEVFRFAKQDQYADVFDCLAVHQDYILHLTDIIDRMETRIVNLTGDVDYLKEIYEKLALEYAYSAEYEGVPEDWRPDE